MDELKRKEGLGISVMLENGVCLSLQEIEVPERFKSRYEKFLRDLKEMIIEIKNV